MSDFDTSSPTTTSSGDIFGDYTLDQQHAGGEVDTVTDTNGETEISDYTDPPPLLPPIVTNVAYSRIPMPVTSTGSRRSYIEPPNETDHHSDGSNEDGYDEAAAIRAEEVRERLRKGVRRVICVLRVMGDARRDLEKELGGNLVEGDF